MYLPEVSDYANFLRHVIFKLVCHYREDSHSSGHSSSHTGQAVFDDCAAFWHNTHYRGSMQEQTRVRFPVVHLVGTEDFSFKVSQ